MRGLFFGALMLCMGMAFTWTVATAFEVRARQPAVVSLPVDTFPSLAAQQNTAPE
ncbi:MAG: hypothetical protein JSR47_17270 [Proteobacteria bacterium]|nr:hypothetical protein [Pseudomonadota bacterium]